VRLVSKLYRAGAPPSEKNGVAKSLKRNYWVAKVIWRDNCFLRVCRFLFSTLSFKRPGGTAY
jgi:hypothetical protein